MRSAVALLLMLSASVIVLGPASAQRAPTTGSASASASPPSAVPAPAPAPLAMPISPAKCDNPNALGVTRTVEIDTTGGPGFGFEHFKQHDFLRDNEVVLTFDDGPWPTTPAVLKALADECVQGDVLPDRQARHLLSGNSAAGRRGRPHHRLAHLVARRSVARRTLDEAKAEIEKGISAVRWALGGQAKMAPFFRFPALRHPPEIVTYLGERNIAIFSTDMDSFDFKMRKPEQVVNSVMTKLQEARQGHRADARLPDGDVAGGAGSARPAQGRRLQDRAHEGQGFGEVAAAIRRRLVKKEQKLPTVSQRPTSSVVRAVE